MRLMRLIASTLTAVILSVPTMAAAPQATTATPATPSYPAGGKIVSQAYDPQLFVTKTVLANGLTILSKEAHAAPVAYFSVFYKVGSRNETTGKTGLSHILEHMMFKGTKTLPPGSISRLFQRNGGEINAATDIDETYYHELISADRLELAVRIEADRMENSAFDPTQLNHEMSVVRSELEGDSNDPGRQLHDFTFLPLAFQAHSYHWPTLGWRADVENAAKHRDVIYQYYRDHYMPNNATVVVVGDFDTKKLIGICQQYFGVYNAGTLEQHYITPEPVQAGERRATLKRPGTVGQVIIGWHGSPLGDKGHYAMDVASLILSSGRTSRLYQALVEPGIAEDVDASNYDTHDPYVFTVSAGARAGVTNDKVEAALEGEIDKLKTTPVTADELARAKNQIEASFTYQNDSVSEQAEQLGFYQTIYGDYRYLATYLANIKAVTPADIEAVSAKYFTVENRSVATFEPTALPAGATPPPPAPTGEHFGDVTSKASPEQEKTVASLDAQFNTGKHVAPAVHQLPVRKVLPNGIVVLVQENHANKTVAITGLLKAGGVFDPADKPGIADITAAMLSRGAAGQTALQLASRLETVGASVNVGANVESARFSGHALTKDFDLTVATLADELRRPDFPQEQFDRLKGQSLSGIEEDRQDSGGTGGAGAVAELAFAQALYPAGHPYWDPSFDDQEAALKSFTTDDLKSFYAKYYRPDTMIVVIVGDVKVDQAVATVSKYFGDWAKPATPAPVVSIPDVTLPMSPQPTKVVTIPDTSQTSILFGHIGELKRNDPHFYAATVMNYILGGSVFGSRLGDTIRDQNGLAYTVYSDFDATHGAGPFTIFIGTNPDNAAKAISLLKSTIKRFQTTGATQQEVNEAVDYLTGSFPLTLETNAGLASVIVGEEDYGLGLDYVNKRTSLYRKVSVAQVNTLAKWLLHPGVATLVIAGAAPTK